MNEIQEYNYLKITMLLDRDWFGKYLLINLLMLISI
jgi:hypothetical protein